ncbi:MAG: DUF3460 family protein [Polaromonas sp.]|jgi:hypothetical protein|nr:DUF3460 family protein [Polaromonas sp.]
MSIFARAHYTSEVTRFIDELKAKKPTLEAEQRLGRAIWWDKKLDLSEQADYQNASVPQQAYVYGTSGHPNGR